MGSQLEDFGGSMNEGMKGEGSDQRIQVSNEYDVILQDEERVVG